MHRTLCLPVCLLLAIPALADEADVKALLGREIVGPRQARLDVTEYVRPRIPTLPKFDSAEAWAKEAERLRQEVLRTVVFRGQAEKWREHRVQVKWLDTIAGGPGYHIRKLRFEALPGLWIPALLYEPEKLDGKVPVMLAVNGHEPTGKATPYKQERCINLAKRGMLALNVEWLGMGQLRTDGWAHGRMNQLDLCGSSGLAVFFLAMQRGLDVLLAHEHADPKRVGVSGLSGGGWQTIILSSLDTRVTLCNPVAGYSSFLTRLDHYKDLGDSEQTPCDLATLADYTHLTAMMSPRPTLLTYNSKDDCCFESGYALPPLLRAAGPFFKLSGREDALGSHVNDVPGNHNYGKDNREALYRFIGKHWFPEKKDFDAREIDVLAEVKKAPELFIDLPADNADFNTLARALMKDLPANKVWPKGRREATATQESLRKLLREILRLREEYTATAEKAGEEKKGDVYARFWKLKLSTRTAQALWTVPVVELVSAQSKGTTVLIGDGGRRVLHAEATKLLAAGQRLFVVDPFCNGESSIDQRADLFALMVTTIGDRPLGLQVAQLRAVATWVSKQDGVKELKLRSVGPRSSVAALATAGLDDRLFTAVSLHNPLGSLKEIVEKNTSFASMPELFCFGLLERLDVASLALLVAPRPLRITGAGERARKELAHLQAQIKGIWDVSLDPFAEP